LYPKAKIKAFEPDPEVFKCLKTNLKNNRVFDVALYPKAIWTDDNGLEFGREGADGGSIYFDSNKMFLPSLRLKNLLEKEMIVDLLKVDIEGAEAEVFKDCGELLTKVKYIFVEYHSWIHKQQELATLLSVLSQNNFRYYINYTGKNFAQPFIKHESTNGMDIQLNIHAINSKI